MVATFSVVLLSVFALPLLALHRHKLPCKGCSDDAAMEPGSWPDMADNPGFSENPEAKYATEEENQDFVNLFGDRYEATTPDSRGSAGDDWHWPAAGSAQSQKDSSIDEGFLFDTLNAGLN
eukprot:gnl/MRDRNA2_/MRDRNA2_52672_c0_seq1.p1 gnl/MRDRNA2_/MRDRNA2_52672_c0~~gnl/MRDRNA2_/MRDRNA2_52672_c0_seq1.p1  ORF type:complete len:121 (+),score=20.35 gnl/MRDRNA2_/MRDRNA2_52672_c0_seq1:89-451(+)